MTTQPYLFFDGRCDEALQYYRDVFGAEIGCLMRFRDNPDFAKTEADSAPAAGGASGCASPGDPDKVMHGSVRIGGTEILVSDGLCSGSPRFEGFSLSFPVPDEATADRVFGRLAADGGTVQMPIGPTFFSPRFGMVADRFGVSWMVIVPRENCGPETAKS